ncbi:MAG: hypothetical protein ACYS5V_11685, partial [Planctomycetota bacterium]|jgi:prepilin-type processing-associated H-X9-DG protein
MIYVNEYNSYPYLAPWPWESNECDPLRYADNTFDDGLNGFAKFYGVLQASEIRGTKMTTWGVWYYGGRINGIWEGSFCSAMKPAGILKTANHAGNFSYGGNWMYWVWFHKWAIGYQWSPYLRAAHPRGRYPEYMIRDDPDPYRWQWVGHHASLPRGRRGYTQAIRPDELEDTAMKAEAWDSWDLESAPEVDWWGQKNTWSGPLTPGWHAGVASAGGRALLNAFRHDGSPNILYADGHVAADAERPITAADGLRSELDGLRANTWEDWDSTFGNFGRLVPQRAFGR